MPPDDHHELALGWRPDLNGRPPDHSWTPQDLVTLGSVPPEPPTIGGLLYRNRTHILFGPQGAMKTMVALAVDTHVIRTGGTVIHIDHAENSPGDLLERLRAFGLTDNEIRERFIYLRPDEPASDPLVMHDIVAMIQARRPAVVTLDSLIGNLALHNVDPNSGLEIERWRHGVVEPLRCTGAAILALDHVTQNEETRDRPIGSERKLSAFEVGLQAERVHQLARGATGLIRLRTRKDRGAYLAVPIAGEIEFRSDPVSFALSCEIRLTERTANPNVFRPTFLMEKVSRYVEGLPGVRPSRNRVEEEVKGSRPAKRLAIDLLLAEGFLVEEAGPRRARELRSERPYRESEDPLANPQPTSTSPRANSTPGSTTSPDARGAKSNPHEQTPSALSLLTSPDFAPTSPHGAGTSTSPTSPTSSNKETKGEVAGEVEGEVQTASPDTVR